MGREFDGVVYDKLGEMQEARRARRLELVSGGMSFTRAAEAAGISKRTGKAGGTGAAARLAAMSARSSTDIVGTWKNRRR